MNKILYKSIFFAAILSLKIYSSNTFTVTDTRKPTITTNSTMSKVSDVAKPLLTIDWGQLPPSKVLIEYVSSPDKKVDEATVIQLKNRMNEELTHLKLYNIPENKADLSVTYAWVLINDSKNATMLEKHFPSIRLDADLYLLCKYSSGDVSCMSVDYVDSLEGIKFDLSLLLPKLLSEDTSRVSSQIEVSCTEFFRS